MKGICNGLMVSLILLGSCSSKTEKESQKRHSNPMGSKSHSNTSAVKKASLNNDTLIVNEKSVVIYQPDSLTMERLKVKMGEEDFYTVADDNAFYISTSIQHLKKLKIPMLNLEGKKIIQFTAIDKKPVIMRIDTITGLGNIYLFEPGKQPYKADITSMDTEAKAYYQ